MRKTKFADNLSVQPIFLMEKLSFSMKLFSGHFYGQSFIKTVRGPLDIENLISQKPLQLGAPKLDS